MVDPIECEISPLARAVWCRVIGAWDGDAQRIEPHPSKELRELRHPRSQECAGVALLGFYAGAVALPH